MCAQSGLWAVGEFLLRMGDLAWWGGGGREGEAVWWKLGQMQEGAGSQAYVLGFETTGFPYLLTEPPGSILNPRLPHPFCSCAGSLPPPTAYLDPHALSPDSFTP